jgi:alanyl-tRNA synthetase
MTDRIYYTDPSCREFDAQVTHSVVRDGRPAAILDRTAFYPTSGGQPFDTGRLGPADVIDTIDEGAEIVHVVSAPLPPGTRVHGAIDWTRRFDHMQQHTGQHVLSAVFDRQLHNPTIGFHMGAEASTIDLGREVSAGEIERAVDEANRVVWEDRDVSVRFVSQEEAERLPLRKEPVRDGPLRLIEIREFDLSACGGTHVPRTGAIGMIAVTGVERVRAGSRLTFVCGSRASRAFREYHAAVTSSARTLSVLPQELPAAVERAQQDAKDLRKTVVRLQESVAVQEAARLLDRARETGGMRIVIQTLDGWDVPGLKAIAAALTSHAGVAAVLLSTRTPVPVVVVRSEGVAVDAGKVLRSMLERFGGRGGGKPDFAQGAGLAGSQEEMRQAALRFLTEKSG